MKENRNIYLMKNTAIFAIGSVSTKLISFLLVPLYTNALSTVQYGVADLITTICTVLAPMIILNLGEGVMRFALDDGADYTKIMSVGLAAFGFALIVGTSVIPIVGAFGQLARYSLQVYFYTITLAGSQLFLCYLRGKEKLVDYALGNIIQTALIAVLNIVFLLVMDSGLTGYFSAYIIASLAVMLFAFWRGNVWEVMRNLSIDWRLARQMIVFSVVLIPNSFMWWIINSSDRILVSALLGASANGIYAVSCKIPQAVSVIANIFNQAWSYSAIHENGSKDRDQYANKVYRALVAVSIISGIFLIMVMKPLMSVFVEASYFEAWRYTPFLVIGNVFMTTGTYLSSWYSVNKDSKGFLFSATCGAIVNVALNLLLIPTLGIMGSAFATCAAMVAVFMYRVKDTKKYISIHVMCRKEAMAYFLLILSAGTMLIDSVLGEMLMLAEFIASLLLLKDTWLPLATRLIGLLRKGISNRVHQ